MKTKEDVFGVALTRCYFCGGSGDILLNTRLSAPMAKKVKDMDGKVINMDPCQKCREFMGQGVILITFDPDKSEEGWNKGPVPNPWRTGGFFVLKDDAVRRLLGSENEAMLRFALEHRWMFIEHAAAEKIGLLESKP